MAQLDNLSKKIVDDALNEKEKILNEAKEEREKILNDAKEKAKKILESYKVKSEQVYKETFSNTFYTGESLLKQEILKRKKEHIEDILSKLKEEIKNLDEKRFREFVKRSFQKEKIVDGEFIIGKEENRIDEKFITKELSKKLKKSSLEPDFEKGLKIVSNKTVFIISPEDEFDFLYDELYLKTNRKLFEEENI
ncbi:MAG: hypothetical protein QME48_07905 [bacterium]|nr:hypothetical protein [bacterium]